jgi:hypothetical protein
MNVPRSLVPLAVLSIIGCAQAQVNPIMPPGAKVTLAERNALFRRMDQLGYTEKLKGKLVRFDRENYSVYALRHRGDCLRFNLAPLDHWTRKDRVAIAPPIQRAMESEIIRFEGQQYRSWGWYGGYSGPTILEPIAWARFADIRGYRAWSDRFLRSALLMNVGEPLMPEFERIAGKEEVWRSLTLIADSNVAWSKHQLALRRFISRFPSHPDAPYAADLIKQISRTVKLDRKKGRDSIGKLIDELAHEPDPNWLAWWKSFDYETSTHNRLSKLGTKAVPSLIKALGDARITHHLKHKDPFREHVDVVTRVGQHIDEVLRGIAPDVSFSWSGWVPDYALPTLGTFDAWAAKRQSYWRQYWSNRGLKV